MAQTWKKPPPSPFKYSLCLAARLAQMSFCPETPKLGVSKFSKLGLLQLWRPITSCENLRLRWSLKKSCSFRWEVSNGMWHATWTQINQGNYWFLVVESQIANLTPDLSFGHNLCFKYSNESSEPILDIYVPRSFQWYNYFFNKMSFYPYDFPLKIWKSIGSPFKVQFSKWEPILECVGSFPNTFLHS